MADTIATKYIIEGDSSGAQKAFKDLAKVSDDFWKSIKDFWKKYKEQFATMALVWGATFWAIVLWAKTMIDAYAESEKAMARFNSVMATTGKWSEEASKKILALADAHVQLWFDDEDSAESLAKFYQRTKDVTEATRLNAIAMDLARAKNIGLADASNLVGQVLSGNGKLLKQYGIDIDDTKKPLEALGELHTKVKGQAEAFADTYAGRMEILNVQIGNIKESIGWPLAEVMTSALKQISPLVQKIWDWIEKNPELVKNIILIAGAVSGFVTVLWTLGLAIPAIVTWLWFFLWPIGLIITAVWLLATAWATNFWWIQEKTAQVFGMFRKMVDGDWQWAWDDMLKIAKSSMDAIDDAANAFNRSFSHGFATVMDGASSEFLNWFTKMMDSASQWFIDGFTNLMDIASNAVITWFMGIMEYAANFWANFIMTLIEGIDSKIDAFINSVAGIGKIIEDYVGFHSPTRKWPWKDADKWMPNFVQMMIDGIEQGKNPFENTINEIAWLITKWFNKKKFEEAKDNIREFVTSANRVFNEMERTLENQMKKVEDLKGEYKDLSDRMSDVLKQIAGVQSGTQAELSWRAVEIEREIADLQKERDIRITSWDFAWEDEAEYTKKLDALNKELDFIKQRGISEQDIINARTEADKTEAQKIIDRSNARIADLEAEKVKIQTEMDLKKTQLDTEAKAYQDLFNKKRQYELAYYDVTHSVFQKQMTETDMLIQKMHELAIARNMAWSGGNPWRASGGPVVAGRAYTVGEYGRETFVPASGGHIVNAGDTARGSAQAITIEINNPSVRSDTDIQWIADAVENVLIKRAKNFTLWIA